MEDGFETTFVLDLNEDKSWEALTRDVDGFDEVDA
jgi:hypothetical protein